MKEKSKFVVLFLHNCKDEVTLYNYDRIKKFNPDVDIYPVGFDWHDLIEDSHRVYRHDEFPNNKILNAALNWNNTKTESDLCIYDFFLHYQDYDSYFIIEWDTYCNCSIEEIYGEAINSHDMFCSQMFTNQFYGPGTDPFIDVSGLDIEKSHERYVRRGSWYRYFFSKINEPTEQGKLLPYLGSASTTSLLHIKHAVLHDMMELLLNNPSMYNNIQNEMRIGTLIQQTGYILSEFGSNTNHFKEEEHYRKDIFNNVKGYYHPIKDVIKV